MWVVPVFCSYILLLPPVPLPPCSCSMRLIVYDAAIPSVIVNQSFPRILVKGEPPCGFGSLCKTQQKS